MIKRRASRILLGLCLLLASVQALALPFGQNKVRRKAFDWKIISTAHFDVYFYPEEEALARKSAALAEKAYAHNTPLLDYYPKARTPFFVFQNHVEFEQTNVSRDILTEGVGGFTEPFKNRVVFPTSGSDKWLETVISHEFTHAIQFDILYGEGARSFQVLKNYIIPLWMIEGMAEYCAENWDTYADMVMRDAVINERLKPLHLLDGFNHLDEVYVGYKLGQTAVQYLSDHYGKDKVALLIKKFKAQLATDQVLRDVTGRGTAEFNKEWTSALKQKYWVQAQGKESASTFGTPLTRDSSAYLSTNNGMAWSPDGKRIAYIASRDGREEIWTMDFQGRSTKPLFKGPYEAMGRSGDLGVPGNRLSWSPDGRTLAFVISDQSTKWMILKDLHGGTRRWRLDFDDLQAPAFSPDGKWLAFGGSRHGASGIYVAAPDGSGLREVAGSDGLSLMTDPAWSPDGKWLCYSAESNRKNRVYLVGADGTGGKAITPEGFNCRMPAFASGSKLFYCSDESGVYNLVESGWDGSDPKSFTNVVTGVFCPRPSPDGSKLLFVAYEDGCQNIYSRVSPEFKAANLSPGLRTLANPYVLAAPGDKRRAAAPPPVPLPLSPSADAMPALVEAQADTRPSKSLAIRPYRLAVSPDLVFLLLGYDSSSGPVGGGYVTASDMLGEHNFTAFADFVPGYQSVAQVEYVLLHGRVDTSLAAFYRRTSYPYYTNFVPDSSLPIFYDQQAGGSLIFRYPFTRFSRAESGVNLSYLYRDLTDTSGAPKEVLATLGGNILNSLYLALVHDTSTYHAYEPLAGNRENLTESFTDRWLGSTKNFVLTQLELQYFHPIGLISRDTVFSGRLLGVGQSGMDRELFYLGGFQVRGLDYGEYLVENFALLNLEVRRPFIEDINVTLWPLNFLLIKDLHLALFYDTGMGASNWQDLTYNDVRSGWGGGLRLHTFMVERQLLTWRFDIAHRSDRGPSPERPDNTHYYFSLGTLF